MGNIIENQDLLFFLKKRKHVVFGQVIDGMPVVREIGKVPVDIHDKPRIPVVIVDCGEVDDPRNFLRVF